MGSISPFLWFDDEAEEATRFYVSLFPNSSIDSVNSVPGARPDVDPDRVFAVSCTLDGMRVLAMNGGPRFPFTEAVSFFVEVDTQDEVNRYWEALTAHGGSPSRCGWLKDRWGLSWQIAPRQLGAMLSASDRRKADSVMRAMLKMDRLVIEELEAAFV